MEDLEDFSARLFGKGRKTPDREDPFLSGAAEGLMFGLGLAGIFGLNQPSLGELFTEIEAKTNLKDKLSALERRVKSGNALDVYGGALMLFSELEKFTDALYDKKIRGYYKPESFKDKIHALDREKVISSIETDILCNKIYPKRNLIAHGEYQKVNPQDVIACWEYVKQFILKYYPLLG
ncbi:MAG: hypothetical protein LBG90_01655 [Spirochaetaceae bacterium]|jgi:hypothetical protein|nr:hypothetical protein [Spirochaetaceae bacterium]